MTIDTDKCLDFIRIAKTAEKLGMTWASERKEWRYALGRWKIRARYRSSNSLMGRFGGGWNWKLGFQLGTSTIIFSLLVAELSIAREKASKIREVQP